MSEFIEKLKSRRSVRSFKSDMPPKEVIDEIISAGLYAPSGMNRQPVIIVAVTNKEMRDKLSELNRQIGDRLSRMNAEIMGKDVDPFYNAPVVLIVLADKAAPTYLYDGTLAMENLMLAAHDEGLGSCWIHRAKEEFESKEGKEILESLGIEGDYEGIGHCVIGYVNGEYPKTSPRRENRVFYVE